LIRTDFATFKKGDRVTVIADHPYLNTLELTPGEIYIVDKMLDAAGVVTLEGKPYNKTFPDQIFRKIDE
jgi:hypothetical protein